MMKYLIVLLDDSSVSFCHYPNNNAPRKLIPMKELSDAIVFGMKENMYLQFVYPDYQLPQQYEKLISSVEHVKIKPISSASDNDIALASFTELKTENKFYGNVVLKATVTEIEENITVLRNILVSNKRVNIIIGNGKDLSEAKINEYKDLLNRLSDMIYEIAITIGYIPQLNILTDRLSLNSMNNCNAGIDSITIAPDGNFYICPGFYYDGECNVGSLSSGLSIPNEQLYSLEYAPICLSCDAFHCRRCIWLNKKRTLEVNTPSRNQCVVTHLERNASRYLLTRLREAGPFMEENNIPAIDYLDPFDKLL